MSHQLDGARAKLARARLHIEDVRRVEMTFIDSNPYGFRLHYDPMGSGQNSAHAIVRADVTPLLSPIIGDALHNLRASLDYLAFELFRLENPTGDGGRVYFPVCKVPPTDAGYKTAFLDRIPGISNPVVVDALDALQPYHFVRPEQDLLAVLHHLDIQDKHQALALAGGAVTGMQITAVWPKGAPTESYVRPFEGRPLGLADHDVVLFRYPSSAHPLDADVTLEATFRVVVRDVRPGLNKAIVPLLGELAEFVDKTLASFAELFPRGP